MSTDRPLGTRQAPGADPAPLPDVLGWELAEAVHPVLAGGLRVWLVPAASPAAAVAPRWRVARQTVLPDGDVLLTVVPEAPGQVEPGPSAAGWKTRD
ncbi:MAG TPA: hypothetical protein VIK93_02015 [Limnochordales bacterium]